MVKIYVVDTNVLLQAPYALESFEDNQVVLPMIVLEELDQFKKAEGEIGANARRVIRCLEQLRLRGDLIRGVPLENDGTVRVEKNYVNVTLPEDLSDVSADNRILRVCLGLDDCVSIAPDGSFAADGETVNLLNGIRSARQQTALTEYQCAPDTKWADVHIRKKDGDNVSIWVKGEAPIQINYMQLGMCNQKKGCRTEAFTALLALLSMPGKVLPLPARDTREYDFWKHRKYEICAALRKFFPNINDGDPIEFVKNEGYQVRFVNRDDASGSSNYHPSRT